MSHALLETCDKGFMKASISGNQTEQLFSGLAHTHVYNNFKNSLESRPLGESTGQFSLLADERSFERTAVSCC